MPKAKGLFQFPVTDEEIVRRNQMLKTQNRRWEWRRCPVDGVVFWAWIVHKRVYCKIECRSKSSFYRTNISEAKRGMKYSVPASGFYMQDGYKCLTMLREHLLSDRAGNLLEHRLVLWNKLRCESLDCVHECNWCFKSLAWGGWEGIQADHLDGNRSNNDPDNLVVSCGICNRTGTRLRERGEAGK